MGTTGESEGNLSGHHRIGELDWGAAEMGLRELPVSNDELARLRRLCDTPAEDVRGVADAINLMFGALPRLLRESQMLRGYLLSDPDYGLGEDEEMEAALNEANKLLDRAIEVLRAFYLEPPWYPDSGACRFCGAQASPGVEHYDFCAFAKAKPLLDNLKARMVKDRLTDR